MEKEKTELKGARELRRKAEDRLKSKPAVPEKMSELETQELVQELRVHQTELEMQNEELRRTQAVLEESRAKYSDLYDFAPVGYLTLNRQGMILEANLTACSKLGKERSFLINTNSLFANFIIKKVEKDLFYQHLGKIFEAKSLETCELELKGRDNTKFYAQLESVVVKDNLSQCRTAMADITERKQAETELLSSKTELQTANLKLSELLMLEEQLAAIVESSGDAIIGITIGVTVKGTITSWNKGAQKLYGYPAEEVLGKSISLLVPPELTDDLPHLLRQVRRGEHTNQYDITHVRKDGQRIPVTITISPILNSAGMVVGASVAARDITERKRAEEQLAEEKKNLEKANLELDSFVYTASHDLRAPLRAIASFSTFLEEDYKDKLDKQGRDHLNEIRNGTNRMNELIDDLLSLSRISRIQNPYEDVDMNQLIESVLERIKYDIEKFEVELQVPKDLPVVRCDRIKITEVFANLIDNAIKFSSKNTKHIPKLKSATARAAKTTNFMCGIMGLELSHNIMNRFSVSSNASIRPKNMKVQVQA